jgi:uncharacterized membrane protein HdeD (DUF308 family)
METLLRNWWAQVVRGVIAILFGVLALVRPAAGLGALVFLFGFFAFANGIFALMTALRAARGQQRWGTLAVEGILSVAAGLVVWLWPGAGALALVYLIGIWALAVGLMELATAIQIRRYISGEWMLILAGVLSLACGVLVLVWPRSAALAITWTIGIYAIAFGVLLMVLGFKLRDLYQKAVHAG